MKIFVYLGIAIPLAIFFWITGKSIYDASPDWTRIAIMVSLDAGFIWLFFRLYSYCSVVLTSNGISQTLFFQGGLARKRYANWDDIQKVRFSGNIYYFTAHQGNTLELNTALFANGHEIIKAVHSMLPPRLLETLEMGTSKSGSGTAE